jgi:hypothetical protein
MISRSTLWGLVALVVGLCLTLASSATHLVILGVVLSTAGAGVAVGSDLAQLMQVDVRSPSDDDW